MLWEHEPQVSVSTALSSYKLSRENTLYHDAKKEMNLSTATIKM